jgi:hypothetical protein
MNKNVPVHNPNGLPIVDATEDLIVQVKKKEIRSAVPLDPERCAVAKTCKLMPGVIRASIHKHCSYVVYADRIVRYMTTRAVLLNLVSLDRGGAFAEGVYRLKAPVNTQKIGSRLGRPRGKNNGTKPRSTPVVTVMTRA